MSNRRTTPGQNALHFCVLYARALWPRDQRVTEAIADTLGIETTSLAVKLARIRHHLSAEDRSLLRSVRRRPGVTSSDATWFILRLGRLRSLTQPVAQRAYLAALHRGSTQEVIETWARLDSKNK